MTANAARVGRQTGVSPGMDAETKPILVVDDNPITARWVESLVRRIGFEVIVAFDGEDAIHQLAEQPVGIVISDVEMPVMNGFDLLQFIRLRWPELPVILMSATSNAERREAARRLGAMAFLEKPVNSDQLAALIGGKPHRNEPVDGLHLFAVS
jgi:DNA-binding NtrC family response regulator